MRRIIVLIAVLVAAVGGSVVLSAPAYAVPNVGDLCRQPPAPSPPKRGLSGLLTSRPDEPATGDPFADPRIPISDVYGTSWRWEDYGIGCPTLGAIVRDPLQAATDTTATPIHLLNTQTGNRILDIGAAWVAVLDSLERLALDTDLEWFSGWVSQVITAVRPLILGGMTESGPMPGLLPLAILVAAVIGLTYAARQNLAGVARLVVVAVVCVGLAGAVMAAPAAVSRGMDTAARTAGQVGGAAFSASLSDGANRHALYRAWLAGWFGDPDSEVAREYGPRLMAATHYTWAEWDRVQDDTEARKALDEKKGAEFTEIAETIGREHSAVYQEFQGRGARPGAALFGLVALGFMATFGLVAFLIVLAARFVMQVLLLAAPVAAVAGVLPGGEQTLQKMWHLFWSAIFAAFKFMLAAGIMVVALGLLSTLGPVTALLSMLALTIIALAYLKPIRSFKSFTPGLDPNRSYLKEFASLIAKAIAAAFTGGVAGVAAGSVAVGQQQQGQDAAIREHADLRVVSRPALPAPTFVQLEPGGPPAEVGPSGRPQLPPGPSGGGGPRPYGPGPAPVPRPELPPSGGGPVVVRLDRPVEIAGQPSADLAPSPERVPPEQVVIEGQVIDSATTYRRPSGAPEPARPDMSADRDRGTDQPAGELVLYQRPERVPLGEPETAGAR